MKPIIIAILWGVSALASPRGLAADVFVESSQKLTWKGAVQLGEPDMSFVGTAEEIYQRILQINPNYDSELGINSRNSTSQILELGGIEKRSPPIGPTSSNYVCTYGTYVSVPPIDVGIQSLYNIGTGSCTAPPGAPGAGGCSRVTCSTGAGIWLCNDSSSTLTVPCQLVADNAVEVLIKCQYTTYSSNTWNSYVRGQIFSINGLWNVIINTPGASC